MSQPAETLNPYAPPSANISAAPTSSEYLVLADRGIRLGACILDYAWIVVAVIPLAVMLPFIDAKSNEPPVLILAMMALLSVAVIAYVIYNMVLIHRHGQTLGKKILNIKIVRPDGSRCSLRRYIFLRYIPIGLLSNIPFLGLLVAAGNPLMIFREDRRCGHDFIADTIVVTA
jgi:uncharacterized RDD family membrane protein YckC